LLRKEINGIGDFGKGDSNVLEEKVPPTEQRLPDYVQNGRSGKV
jgi:hypothetical protein